MNYMILKTTDGGYYCVNGIIRGQDAKNNNVDSIAFLCSNQILVMPIDKVVSITPSTPTP